MPDRARRDSSLEIVLDRYWTAVLADSADPPGELIDPDLVATVQRVHALDVAPPPSSTFASRLWEDLMHANAPTATARPGTPFPVAPSTRWVSSPGQWKRHLPAWSVSRLAAAVLLLALLAGSIVAALYPLQHRGDGRLPLVAPAGTPSVEPGIAPGSPVVDLTLTDTPPYTGSNSVEGGIARTIYPPGGSSQERSATRIEVLYIEVGPMTVSGTTVPQPVRVLPPHDAPGNPPERHLAEGQELVLETGTTLVAAPETVIELRNEGSAPTSMLDLLWITPSTSSESGGAIWGRATNTKRQELAPPISVVLWHLNVEAGATIPPPASESIAQSAAALDPKRIFNLRPEPDGSIRNTSDAPLEVYLLNVSGTPATPVAGT